MRHALPNPISSFLWQGLVSNVNLPQFSRWRHITDRNNAADSVSFCGACEIGLNSPEHFQGLLGEQRRLLINPCCHLPVQ